MPKKEWSETTIATSSIPHRLSRCTWSKLVEKLLLRKIASWNDKLTALLAAVTTPGNVIPKLLVPSELSL